MTINFNTGLPDSIYEAKATVSPIKEAIEALKTCLAMAEHGDFSTGYCCCGSSVEGHTMGDGHSPVDEGDYHAINAFDKARAALAALRSMPAEPVGEREAFARRYKWLRAQFWSENTLAVVLRPKDNTKLGCFLPFGKLLDDAIDHMSADGTAPTPLPLKPSLRRDDLADAAEILRAHGHFELAEQFLGAAEATPPPAPVLSDAWQPISTAPKDGTTVLVWFKQHGSISVRWADRHGDCRSEFAHWHVDDHKHGPFPVRGYCEGDDTHWQPLPPPPIEQAIGRASRGAK